MNPIVTLLIAFDEKLIVITLRTIGNIQQDVRIAKRLFYSYTSNIHRTARQVI